MADSTRLIWVLKGARTGDTAQALALAAELGGSVEKKQLRFNASHLLPNWLLGPRISHLATETRLTLQPPWPDIVVATGRRTAPVALWIKQQSGGATQCVQIGRPRMALSAFDLVITTPQYGLPPAGNVMETTVPFAMPRQIDAAQLAACEQQWSHLPRPWTLAAIGGGKFPQRLGAFELAEFAAALNRHAESRTGSILLFPSPRSAPDATGLVSSLLTVPHWASPAQSSGQSYQAALSLSDMHAVTSDSVSMLTEMLATGKPASVFSLPESPFALRWTAKKGPAALLARNGILHPPRNVAGFVAALNAQGAVGHLQAGTRPANALDVATLHRDAMASIKLRLKL